MQCPKCRAKVKDGASFCPNCGNKLSSKNDGDLIRIFKSNITARIYHNDDDCLVFPLISESKLGAARTNFNIDYNEKILWIRDTSFWSTVNQGMVMTDKGIHAIWDNDDVENSSYFIDWGNIERVWYQELVVHFQYTDVDVPISASNIIKESNEDVLASHGRTLAQVFNRMAQAVQPQEDPVVKAFGHYDELTEAGKHEEAYNYAKELQTYDLGQNQWLAFDCAASSAFKLGKYEKAIDECNKELELLDVDSGTYYVSALYRRYSANFLLENVLEARKDCLTVSQLATDEVREGDGLSVKEDATNDFNFIEAYIQKNFLTRPYNERKVLMPVKKYTDLHQDIVNVISIQNLPQEIIFPMGHPIANQLYIGHPLLPHKYIPFESYQLELIEDKVREFCSIAQALGATDISIECLNASSNDNSVQGQRHIEGNASHRVANGNGSWQNTYSRRLIEELSHSIKLHQTFTPVAAPTLPENLVWYQNEPSWQRLYNQRMSGSLHTHEERIESRKSQMVEHNEMNEIKGEIKTLFASMGGTWDKSEDAKYQIQENAVLSINVTFAPMNQLIGQAQTTSLQQPVQATQTPLLTTEEQEYLDEVKECLADGEIGSSERRLLSKLAAKLGISEERAAELETSLQKPQLTEEEQEHLEAYLDAMEDGVISEKERRLLDKLIRINNISEVRAKEIEMLH